MNKGGSGSGCLAGILLFCALGGNAFLFTGALNDDLKDNSFAWIMVIFAVIADIALIGYIISSCAKSFERRQEEKEKIRISQITLQVNNLIEHFTPSITIFLQKAQPFITEPQYLNQEVVSTVNHYKELLSDKYEYCYNIDKNITQILSCKGCKDFDEKLEHLTSKSEELQQLKTNSDLIHKDISEKKIKLLNEDTASLSPIKAAFTTLLASKKCVIDGYELKDVVCEETPAELSIFEYKYAPVILHIDDHYYCLFNDFILVFDYLGVFTSAIDPTAFSITAERVNTDILISNNTFPAHQFVDIDSKCIKQGNSRRTWAYTCRDGSPDLRYSYNPSVEYRTDTYEYGKITISLLNTTILITVSSTDAIEAFIKAKNKYNMKCNDRHNSIPELLQLLCNVSEKDEQGIIYVSEKYKSNTNEKNYFCNIS